MKMVIWKDDRGYERRSCVPDNADVSQGSYGIPAGPPDIDQIDWEAVRREIAHALVFNEAWSFEEVQRNQQGIIDALNVLKRHLIRLYREEGNKPSP